MLLGMTIADEKYIAFTTFRKSGEPVVTTVWVVPVSDGRIGFWTAMGSGKTKRLKNNPSVKVQPTDARGRAKAGTTATKGTAEMVQSGPLFEEVQRAGRSKYGVMVPISKLAGRLFGQRKAGQQYGDTVVLVRLQS
jgi:PPOX class probable F420-dependent enzyme